MRPRHPGARRQPPAARTVSRHIQERSFGSASSSQAARQRPRSSSAAERSNAASVCASVRGLVASPPLDRPSFEPRAGDDGVVQVAEHVLEPGRRVRERTRLLADDRRGRLGRVAGALRADPDLVELSVRRRRRRAPSPASRAGARDGARAPGSRAPRARLQRGRVAGALAASTSRSRRLDVPVATERSRSSACAVVARCLQRRRARGCGLSATSACSAPSRRRSSNTSPSRTSPRIAAIQPSSSRSADDHSSSTSGRNVRRSERRRRVATRAWWTPSGSTSSRTTGSCRMSRITDSAIARRTMSPARRAGAEVSHCDLGRQRRRAARAHGCTSPSGRASRRLPERRALDERVEEVGRHLLADLDLELAKRGGGPPPFEHRDRVVDDAGDEPPVRVVQLGATADGRHAHALAELPRDGRSHARARPQPRVACRRSPRTRSRVGRGTACRAPRGSLTVQPSPGR